MRNFMKGIAVAALVAGTSLTAHAKTEWLMATGYPESNFHTKNIMMMIEEVEKEVGDEFGIVLHPNDTLIKHDAIKRAVQAGQVPMGEIRLGVYGNEDPMYILAGIPAIAGTYEDAWTMMEAQKPYFDKIFGEKGMRVVAYAPWPGQGFYTKFPVNEVEDFAGKKLRIYSTATQRMGEMLGFQATILPFAEVPQAFSTGLIEALFTSPQTGIDVQAWDNTSHFTLAGTIYSKNAIIVNDGAFSALPENVQKAVTEAGERATVRGWEMSEASLREQMGILASKGMAVTDAPASVMTKLDEIGLVMVEEWRQEASAEGNAVLDNYLAAREAKRKTN